MTEVRKNIGEALAGILVALERSRKWIAAGVLTLGVSAVLGVIAYLASAKAPARDLHDHRAFQVDVGTFVGRQGHGGNEPEVAWVWRPRNLDYTSFEVWMFHTNGNNKFEFPSAATLPKLLRLDEVDPATYDEGNGNPGDTTTSLGGMKKFQQFVYSRTYDNNNANYRTVYYQTNRSAAASMQLPPGQYQPGYVYVVTQQHPARPDTNHPIAWIWRPMTVELGGDHEVWVYYRPNSPEGFVPCASSTAHNGSMNFVAYTIGSTTQPQDIGTWDWSIAKRKATLELIKKWIMENQADKTIIDAADLVVSDHRIQSP